MNTIMNYLMDHILYLISKIILNMYLKTHEGKTVKSSIKIYINKIKNRIKFKIKTGYYLELSTPESIKLLGSTKSKITKDENGENLPYSEITETVLIYCNIVSNNYQQSSRVFIHLFAINCLVNY